MLFLLETLALGGSGLSETMFSENSGAVFIIFTPPHLTSPPPHPTPPPTLNPTPVFHSEEIVLCETKQQVHLKPKGKKKKCSYYITIHVPNFLSTWTAIPVNYGCLVTVIFPFPLIWRCTHDIPCCKGCKLDSNEHWKIRLARWHLSWTSELSANDVLFWAEGWNGRNVRVMFKWVWMARNCICKVKGEVLMSAADLTCKVVKQSSPANVHNYVHFHQFLLTELLFCRSLRL